MKRTNIILSLTALAMLLVGCEGSQPSSGSTTTVTTGTPTNHGTTVSYNNIETRVEQFMRKMDTYNTNIRDVKWMKHSSLSEGYVVFRQEGYDGGFDYVAVDLTDWRKGMSYYSFMDNANTYYSLRPDPSMNLYYFDGANGTITFEETEVSTKDLEKVGAFIEAAKVEEAGETIAAEFGLSEERGLEVAKLASNWKSISSKRAMTKADADLFAAEVLGANVTEISNAVRKAAEGDESSYKDLIEKASKKNEVDPEQMSEIINEFMY